MSAATRLAADDSLHAALRAATRAAHEAVDAALGRFDLSDRAAYSRFLAIHAAVVPSLEAAIAKASPWQDWEPRTPLLLADLDALDAQAEPQPVAPWPTGQGAAWGLLYVMEGSRIGGAFLARQVGADLPRAYLSDGPGNGRWKGFLAALEAAAAGQDPRWRDEAIAAARAAFAAFLDAAQADRLRQGPA